MCRPEQLKTVAVAGLGLIGGSVAKALKRSGGLRVLGIDTDPDTRSAALGQGAVDEAGDASLLASAQLLILALNPRAAVGFLEENGHLLPRGALVSDVCGVKQLVVQKCDAYCRSRGLAFVGGHPMAGKEQSGFSHSDPDLFRGASYILTPLESTDPFAVELMKTVAGWLGCARVTLTTPEHHDRVIAFTSQLPHVLAGAYMKSPVSGQHRGYSAGSYRDVSRVASVDENLWSELFLANAGFLCEEIDSLIFHLSECRDAVARQDREQLKAVLRQGRLLKEKADQSGEE